MNNKGVSIFILVDALGWKYIKDRPFLNDLAVTKQPVKSILGFSSGVIPSILTGKYPQEHKHWSLYYYSPGTSPFRWTKTLLWLPKPILHSRIMRKLVEEISKRIMGYSGYFETYLIPMEQLHMFDICEKRNIYAPGGIGHTRSIFDIFKNNSVQYKCFTYPSKDKEIFSKARDSIEKKESNLYFLYLSESDALLHRSCKNAKSVEGMLDYYEKEIRNLYAAAKSTYGEVNLYIFSDHGMAAVNESLDLVTGINNLNLKVPNDYVAFYDSTMARFWFFNETAKTKITSYLSSQKYGRLINKEEIVKSGIDFSENQYGETIFLMDTGVVINPSYMNQKVPEGMHGFDINDSSMDAVLISNKAVDLPSSNVKEFFGLMTAGLTKKVKVMYFLNSTVRAGAEEHVLRLIERIDRDKFDPILVCPQELLNLLSDDLPALNIKCYPISIRRWRNFAAIRRFWQVLKEERPEIVHTHLFFATRFAAPIAKFADVPMVIETAHLREAWRKGLKKAYFVDRFFYRYVDKIIAVSKAVKNYLVEEKGILTDKIIVIHNGIDLEKFKPQARKEDSKFTIGMIGRLEPQKGHRYLFEAISLLNGSLKNAKFLIVGEGSLKESLVEMTRNLKIDERVEFTGYQNDVVRIMNSVDLLVLPSLYEGLPLVLLEAGAMGKPVIATDVDGSSEVVIREKTGLLVPPKDSQALKLALERLVENTALAKEFGLNGRIRIKEQFSINVQVRKTENLYSC